MKILKAAIILYLTRIFLSCGGSHDTHSWIEMDKGEALMTANPDSTLKILSMIDKSDLSGREEKARYALLMSMALDKNYIDTTNFDVLQPAIDYYVTKGTPDEKLRTYYYKGRIYQNNSDFDNAMQSFLKAGDIQGYSDTTTYANMLVAQGLLYYKSYEIDKFADNNIEAAKLYETTGDIDGVITCLKKALNGSMILKDKHKADSIMSITDSLIKNNPALWKIMVHPKVIYATTFGSDSDITAILGSISDYKDLNSDDLISMAFAYLKIGETERANSVFEMLDTVVEKNNPFRYKLLKHEILAANGNFKEAYAAANAYHDTVESENSVIYSDKIAIAHDRYESELAKMKEIQKRDTFVWVSGGILLIVILIAGIIYYKYRLLRIKRMLIEKEKEQFIIENDFLQSQNAVLMLEKRNSELEHEKQMLAADNMQQRISQLEDESESLKNLLSNSGLSKPILAAIQERIGMLNALLAAHITENDSHSKSYDKWVKQLIADKDKFMHSTQLAYRASHPAFMKYLEDHGLDESELNYVCLYAIGMKGREIGDYIQMKRHYHMSSDIRKKLGLKDNDTNLGIYIRTLMNL